MFVVNGRGLEGRREQKETRKRYVCFKGGMREKTKREREREKLRENKCTSLMIESTSSLFVLECHYILKANVTNKKTSLEVAGTLIDRDRANKE